MTPARTPQEIHGLFERAFTGKERDSESGLDYFGARYYGAVMGRFTSPDPVTGTALHIINPQRWNMDAYALNNPLFDTDPDGREGTATHGVPAGSNEVQTLSLPNVQFGSNGLSTSASWNALANVIGSFEHQDPASINFAYFKTSEADTLALDSFLRSKRQASNQGSLFPYLGLGNNCADFCINGLSTARALSSEQAANASVIPNILFFELSRLANAVSTGQSRANDPKKRKEDVTERICYEGQAGCKVP